MTFRTFRSYLKEANQLKVSKDYWNKLNDAEKEAFKIIASTKYGFDVQSAKSFLTAIKKKFGGVEKVSNVKPNLLVDYKGETLASSKETGNWLSLGKSER
jgi:hypothetical protein